MPHPASTPTLNAIKLGTTNK